MSSTRCEAFHWMTPLFCVSVLISLYVPILERPLLYLLCILTTLSHWHYGTKVVSFEIQSQILFFASLISHFVPEMRTFVSAFCTLNATKDAKRAKYKLLPRWWFLLVHVRLLFYPSCDTCKESFDNHTARGIDASEIFSLSWRRKERFDAIGIIC